AISIEELRGILRDAGINVAPINFAGPMSCTVSRSDVQYDEKDALQQWITAKQSPPADATSDNLNNQTQNDPATSTTSTTATTAPSAVAEAPSTSPSDASPIKSLRQSLLEDVAMRLSLPTDSLQVNFKAQDERVLNISSPLFRYQIDPISVRTLGNVSWNVSIISNDGSSKKVAINAEARAWQNQLLINKPLAAGQVIRVSDLTPRRALVNELSDDPLVTSEQVVGQQAGRELKSGTVLTARMIDPVQLVKTGQFVTITLDQGTVKIRTVARALEGGSFGQTIRVKNESTNDIYQVVVTGPQAATMNLATPLATAAGPPE
ncbi:MAG TPA: flagellar basal body P-ring formation chaperone FlgA, partial [Tepidisphaeraceae bacterium]